MNNYLAWAKKQIKKNVLPINKKTKKTHPTWIRAEQYEERRNYTRNHIQPLNIKPRTNSCIKKTYYPQYWLDSCAENNIP